MKNLSARIISPDLMYPGGYVLDLIEAARIEERQRAAELSKAYSRMMQDINELLFNIELWTTRIADVALALKPGEKLRVYLKSYDAHAKLTGRLHTVNRLFGEYKPIFQLPDDYLVAFNTAVEEFATHVDKTERGESDGAALVEWIETHGPEWAAQLSNDLKASIDSGGPELKPELKALYRLARSLQGRPNNHQWSKITKRLREQIISKEDSDRSKDEHMVFEAWRNLDHTQRRKQVEYVLSDKNGEQVVIRHSNSI